jgi:hypothetical protein
MNHSLKSSSIRQSLLGAPSSPVSGTENLVRSTWRGPFAHSNAIYICLRSLLGFGHVTEHFNKKTITELKIRDRTTTDKLFQVLESTPPKGLKTDLKMGPLEVSSKQPQSSKSYEPVSPLECFLKSESYPEDHFYQRLFKFVDFGRSFNAFLEARGVKESLECIEVLKVLLRCPNRLLKLAGDDHERCVSVPGSTLTQNTYLL